jgi:hypothetical protein
LAAPGSGGGLNSVLPLKIITLGTYIVLILKDNFKNQALNMPGMTL